NNLPWGKSAEAKALRDAAAWEEVKNDAKMPVTRLSGGQQQRLCIVRAVALRPAESSMAEACSPRHPHRTVKIGELPGDLRNKYTIVIVTHNKQQAQRIADKTVFLYLGEIKEEGLTKKIFESPENEMTANYIHGHFG